MSPNEGQKTNKAAWLTIGMFDGVHRGHQAVMQSLVRGAHAAGCTAVAVTFNPHPAEILRDIHAPYYLTTLEEREKLIRNLGVDEVLSIAFTHEFALKTAREYMAELQANRPFQRILVGQDFHFGAKREGDITLLKQLGEEMGFEIEIVPAFTIDGKVVSSSNIRQLVLEHQMTAAARLLGRWYSVSGEIVHGDGRGRHIGIPTANVAAWSKRLLPAHGVYAARAELEKKNLNAVLNIGSRPTFYFPPAEPTVEVHILDFQDEIYGKILKVNFIEFIRSEKRFQSAVELTEQIRHDIQKTREVLAHAPQTPDLSA
jgi:riboflavin kinase / FMN adenylyltransferase